MAERDRFELDLAAAFRAYLDDAPTQVRPAELAQQFANAYPRGRTMVGPWRLLTVPRLAWLLLLAAGLLAALVGGTLVVGSQLERRAPAEVAPDPELVLVAALDALWSSPYDETSVAAIYAPNATFYDMVAGERANGLEEIETKVSDAAALGFRITSTTAPIRQGDYLAVFTTVGTAAGTSPSFVVIELKDDMVLNQWLYPAP
jgi:hypothetical protein